eukprot:1936334-Prymnesium_polylepis.1
MTTTTGAYLFGPSTRACTYGFKAKARRSARVLWYVSCPRYRGSATDPSFDRAKSSALERPLPRQGRNGHVNRTPRSPPRGPPRPGSPSLPRLRR